MTEKTLQDAKAWFEAIAEELNDLKSLDMMEMYRRLTQLGQDLEAHGSPAKIPANFVHGCTSNVYISAHMEDGVVSFQGSSEALVVRGYVAILVAGLSGLSAQDITGGTAGMVADFAAATDIRATLTPSRANAFGNVYGLMAEKAAHFL